MCYVQSNVTNVMYYVPGFLQDLHYTPHSGPNPRISVHQIYSYFSNFDSILFKLKKKMDNLRSQNI